MEPQSRRAWLAVSAAVVLGLGGRATRVRAAATAVERREAPGVHSVVWRAIGELVVSQGEREQLTVEAEPAVLAQVVTTLQRGRLDIGFAPGARVHSREPIRFRLALRTLAALHANGAGTVRLGPLAVPALAIRLDGSDSVTLARLQAQSLDARLDGSGGLTVADGAVERQLVLIGGACNVDHAGLASRFADVAIDGSGEVRVAVRERLVVRIAGSGNVHVRGNPQVTQTITGAGAVHRL